jgi:hypothetical protein
MDYEKMTKWKKSYTFMLVINAVYIMIFCFLMQIFS